MLNIKIITQFNLQCGWMQDKTAALFMSKWLIWCETKQKVLNKRSWESHESVQLGIALSRSYIHLSDLLTFIPWRAQMCYLNFSTICA